MGLFYAGLLGAFLTSIYTFRLIFVVFHGKENGHAHEIHGIAYWLPLSVLLILSTFVGAIIVPPLNGVLPIATVVDEATKMHVELLSGGVGLIGIAIAALLYLGDRKFVTALAASGPGKLLGTLWLHAWGFDWLYDLIFVRPFMWIVRVNSGDVFDQGIGLIPRLTRFGNRLMASTENGQVRWYAATMAMGAVVVIAVMVLI